jgi:hypothetical protein
LPVGYADVRMVEPRDGAAGVDGELPDGSQKATCLCRLPQTHRFSRRSTHSSVRSGCSVATGIEHRCSSQTWKVLPRGSSPAGDAT